METTTIYELRVIVTLNDIDCDMCPTRVDKVETEALFSSKTRAIAKAQSILARKRLNDYVDAVRSVVYAIEISNDGLNLYKKIYSKYKYNA